MNGQGHNNGKAARGRARGRARDMFPELPGQRGASARGVNPQAAPPPPLQSQPGPQQAQASGSDERRRPTPPDGGDLPGMMQAVQLGGAEGGGAAGGDQVGRGAIRGRRPLPDIVRTRPANVVTKQGTTGRPVRLSANYFPLLTRTTRRLYHYCVDFAPTEDDTRVRKALLRIHKDVLGGHIFDGMSLFTVHVLRPEPIVLFSKRDSDDQAIRMTVRLVGDVADGDSHYIQVYNTILREAMRYLDLKLVGREYCDPQDRIVIPEFHLELWPKYVTSIRQHENDVMMCCDISFKKMCTNTVLSVLGDHIRRNPLRYKPDFARNVLGTIVMTTYNNKTYRIDDVAFDVTPRSTFLQQGKEISYMEYYKTKYGILIHDGDQPLLITKSTSRMRRAGMSENVYLIPELCRTTGLTEDMRNNFQLMRRVADHERVNPEDRIKKLQKFNQRLLSNGEIKKLFENVWDIHLSSKLAEFGGRVLPPEKIIAGRDTLQAQRGNANAVLCSYSAGPDANWTPKVFANPMLSSIALENWAVITPFKCKRDTEFFVEKLQQSTRGMKFVIAQPHLKEIPDDRILTYKNALEEVRQRYNPQLIMCVMLTNSSDRYAMIKKETCCTNFAVPSQVILSRNLNKPGVLSIATKVAIQMNCKIGGAPWTVEIPLSGLMVAGFDVCHDTVNRNKSYGALVCSLDKSMTRYFSAVSEHTNGEELSNFLAIQMVQGLRKYHAHNGTLPERIVMYRDGVSEGQVPYVVSHEVDTLKERLRTVYGGDTYKLAFIIVTKRINTRIFRDKSNPDPGTVVDECITLPERYDFYLVSQSVRQGTVAPTSYNIISDNINLSPDKLQRLTYKLTHLYFNWSGTVRVPAPTQYAHKLAYLIGKFTHKLPSNMMDEQLFFL